ncbi:unnamed protein product [Porites lobata]|uniref:Uncharacterized protein n=1 Tax=Porites lobata TaxID=104759 RepID=A0ABN8N9S2_9CNID|nr:unnamed protein product [Porites lobata]
MAPGKTHVKDSKKSKQFQVKKGNISGIKKAKTSNAPKKKLKERTWQQIEEINKNFTDVLHTTLIKDSSQAANPKCASAGKEACSQITERASITAVSDVSQDELTKTVENIANL